MLGMGLGKANTHVFSSLGCYTRYRLSGSNTSHLFLTVLKSGRPRCQQIWGLQRPFFLISRQRLVTASSLEERRERRSKVSNVSFQGYWSYSWEQGHHAFTTSSSTGDQDISTHMMGTDTQKETQKEANSTTPWTGGCYKDQNGGEELCGW